MPFVGTKSAFGQATTTAYVAKRFFKDTTTSPQSNSEYRPQSPYLNYCLILAVSRILQLFIADSRYHVCLLNSERALQYSHVTL